MMDNKKAENKISFTGERLVQEKKILNPQRVENLARFNFFRQYISSGRILDFGCGTGEGTHFLSAFKAYEVIGVDISFDALQYANKYYDQDHLVLVCGSILTPFLRNHLFDGIISVEVIEHIQDPHLYLRRVINLLRPNGVFMLTTPNQSISSPTPGSLWPDHVREYTAAELEDLLRQYFSKVVLIGEYIPVYEENTWRKMVRKLSPFVKPILPKRLRVNALPFLFSLIRSDLKMEDVVFTTTGIYRCPTMVAICTEPKAS